MAEYNVEEAFQRLLEKVKGVGNQSGCGADYLGI